jgi:uncharacterized protein
MNTKKFQYISLTVVVIVMMLVGATVGDFGRQANAAPNNDETTPHTITVSGMGEVSAAPDIAYLSVGVDAIDPDVNVAVEDANTRMEALMAALSEAGIAPEDMRTDGYNIYQEYYGPVMPVEGAEATSTDRNYHVSIFLTVTVRDITKVGELITTSLDAGANAINGVSFAIADRAALEAEARKLALANARDKADQIAGELTVSIVAPVKVEELSGGAIPFYGEAARGMGGDAPISTGTLTVTIALNVTYSFE